MQKRSTVKLSKNLGLIYIATGNVFYTTTAHSVEISFIQFETILSFHWIISPPNVFNFNSSTFSLDNSFLEDAIIVFYTTPPCTLISLTGFLIILLSGHVVFRNSICMLCKYIQHFSQFNNNFLAMLGYQTFAT